MKLPRTKLTILSIRHKLSYQLLSLTRHYCNMIVGNCKIGYVVARIDLTGHRALIFTQMTKVLDILEQFLNIHGYRYMRLDGATKIEDRQLLTEKFNRDPKIPVFILSTRSGGLGINLTGADTVIFMTLIGIRQWTSNVKIVVIELVKFEMFTFIDLFLNTPLSPILSRRRTRKDSWITLLFKRRVYYRLLW